MIELERINKKLCMDLTKKLIPDNIGTLSFQIDAVDTVVNILVTDKFGKSEEIEKTSDSNGKFSIQVQATEEIEADIESYWFNRNAGQFYFKFWVDEELLMFGNYEGIVLQFYNVSFNPDYIVNLSAGEVVPTPEVDTTAPTFLINTITGVGQTAATFNVRINEAGVVKWMVTNSSTPPTKSAILAGTGQVASNHGSVSMVANATNTASLSGLTANTPYYLWFYAIDGSINLNETSVQSSISFTTNSVIDTTPPVYNVKAISGITTTGASLNVQINEAGKIKWIVTASSTPPSKADILAGTGQVGTNHGSTDVTANNTATIALTGLSASTAYYLYTYAEDLATTPNQSAIQAALTFSTSAPAYDIAEKTNIVEWVKADAGFSNNGTNAVWASPISGLTFTGGPGATKVTGGLNGKDYITFNNTALVGNSVKTTPSGGYTMYLVYKLNAGGQSYPIVYGVNSGGLWSRTLLGNPNEGSMQIWDNGEGGSVVDSSPLAFRIITIQYRSASASEYVLIDNKFRSKGSANVIQNPGAGSSIGGAANIFSNLSLAELMVCNGVDSGQEVGRVNKYLNDRWAIYTTAQVNIVFEGDSISSGYSSNTSPWTTQLLTEMGSNYKGQILAIAGQSSTLAIVDSATKYFYDADASKNIIFMFICTNDFFVSGADWDQTYAQFVAICTAAKSLGTHKVVACTMLPRVGIGFEGTGKRQNDNNLTDSTTFNGRIRNNFLNYADYLCDFGADTTMGRCPGNSSTPVDNKTLYFDDTHPTNAGAAILKDVAKAVLLTIVQ
jgi:lysophospholipase L1-like esterase